MDEDDDDIQVYKKPWVGLTDAERIELSENIWGSELAYEHDKEIEFARAIEQMLKEKNG